MTNKKNIPLSEIFYLTYIALLLFAKGIGLYDGQPLFRAVLIAALLCCGAKMLMTAYSLKEFLIIAILVSLGGVTYLLSGEKAALLYILMITGMKNVALKRIFRVAFVTWAISFGGTFLLAAAHIIDSPFKIHERFGFGYLIRWSLGQPHPNVLHMSYLTLAMLAVYMLGRRVDLKWLGLLMLGNLYVFLYSLSSTGFIAVSILLALNLYWYCRRAGRRHLAERAGGASPAGVAPIAGTNGFNTAEKVLAGMFLPVCLLISFVTPLVLTGRAFDIVNRIVNTRLNLSRHFLTTAPPTLLGTRTAAITSAWLTMDNSYVFAYVTYGVVLFTLIMAAYFWLIFRYLKADKGLELSLILTALAAGITEPFLFNGSFKNISLFFLGELVFEKKAAKRIIKFKKYRMIYFIPKRLRNYPAALPDLVSVCHSPAVKVKEVYRKNRRRLILISGAFALLGALLCGLFFKAPAGYLAPRTDCDESDQAVVYLVAESHDDRPLSSEKQLSLDQAEAQNIKVLRYEDAETEMYLLSGHIAALERIRGIVTGALLTGLVSFAVLLYCCYSRSIEH